MEHTATYSAEDDKLRIYLGYRLDREEYAKVKAMGFKNAPKQGCQFAVWSPAREDFCLEMAGEIEPEGTTLAERAEAKAERLDALSVKRAMQANSFHAAANAISERFAYGQPILVGHHSERSARRDKARMESTMSNAVRCADAVNYWNYRATSVERHANYKNRDDVRARRIKKLLAELRGYQRDLNDANKAISLWEKVAERKGQDNFEDMVKHYAGFSGMSPYVKREGEEFSRSMWSMLDAGLISSDEVLERSLKHQYSLANSEYKFRWIRHTLNRLAFERGELGEVARYEGDLTPVIIQGFLREHGADKPKATKTETGFKASSPVEFPLHIGQGCEIELSAEEWREKMQASGYEVVEKKRRKTTSTKAKIPLLNPTKEDAQRLQDLWNMDVVKACDGHKYRTPKAATIEEITQAIYSANSKTDYDPFETVDIDKNGRRVDWRWRGGERVLTGEPVFRLRVSSRAYESDKARSVIFLTDKQGKPLPIQWEEVNSEVSA